EGQKLVDAGVVDQDIEPAECLLRLGKQTLDLCRLREIGLHGDCLAPAVRNLGNDAVGVRFARSIVDNNGRALGRQMLGDGGADPLGRASHNRDFVLKLAHLFSPLHELVCATPPQKPVYTSIWPGNDYPSAVRRSTSGRSAMSSCHTSSGKRD